jgi:RNA polymerase sigma factor (sigma-70 family)
MTMVDDVELLRRYAENNSEEAFAEFVRRHLPLVYSVALRRVGGDAHLAQDVSQSVFTDLARKAPALSRRTALTGWLFTSTRFAAAEAVRRDRRRRAHEQEAMNMHEIHLEPVSETDWDQLRPALDGLINELGETDREALLLRFFDGRSFSDVGAKLRMSENTARMRVERALEKLRLRLDRRGFKSTAAALSSVLANQTSVAMPSGLAASVTGSALAGAVAVSGSFLLQSLIMNKLTIGIVSLVAGAGIALSVEEMRANCVLQNGTAELRQITADLAQLR